MEEKRNIDSEKQERRNRNTDREKSQKDGIESKLKTNKNPERVKPTRLKKNNKKKPHRTK